MTYFISVSLRFESAHPATAAQDQVTECSGGKAIEQMHRLEDRAHAMATKAIWPGLEKQLSAD